MFVNSVTVEVEIQNKMLFNMLIRKKKILVSRTITGQAFTPGLFSAKLLR